MGGVCLFCLKLSSIRGAMKRIWMQLLLSIFVGNSAILAGDFKRFEFQPFGGYTVNGDIALNSGEGIHLGSIQVNNSYNAGATFAVNLNELDAIEAFWQRQSADARMPAEFPVPASPGTLAALHVKMDRIHCNFLHHYIISVPRAMPYVMAGLGVSTLHAERTGQSESGTFFSFSLGGGMKYFFTDHFGIRGETRWTPTLLSTSDSSFWCSIGDLGGACVINLKASFQQQLDLTGGVIFRF